MDVILESLKEAQSYIDMMEDLPLYDTFFKEGEDDKEEVASEGAFAAIKKAFEKLIQLVKDMLHSIKDFFASMFLSKEEKEKYKEFKRRVKTDPNLKGQKVFMEDWKEYEKIYNEALKKLEEESKKSTFNAEIANDVLEWTSDKLKALGDKYGEVAKRAAYSVALDTAIDMADACQLAAQGMEGALNLELVSLEKVEKELGEKKAKKFKKDLESAAKNGLFHRIKVALFKRKTATLSGIAKKQAKRLLAFTNLEVDDKKLKVKDGKKIIDTKSIQKGVISNGDVTVDALGGVKNTAATAAGLAQTAIEAEKLKRKGIKAVKEAKRKKDQARDFIFGKKKD